jgi:tetraacyldisaccharide 4'-kinase
VGNACGLSPRFINRMNPFASLILPPLSAIYSAVTRARVTAYRRGWFAISKLPVPVISVGNLTVGGTGKTPLVEYVCNAVARETGKSVCVLTRGYGRINSRSQVLVSDGTKLLAGERESGDEPYLLAQNLMGIAAVICNSNRLAAGDWALKNLGSENFVLDDGFQHQSLARDLDIVTIDAIDPWGGGRLLPSGRLREPRAGLSRADCVVITRTDQVENTVSLTDALRRLATSIPIFYSRMKVSAVSTVDGQKFYKDDILGPIAAFCGIGNPVAFFNQLRREGFTTNLTKAFADHQVYRQSDIDQLVGEAKAQGARALITTAKDALKLTSFKFEIPCYVLHINILIDEETGLVERIRTACQKPERQ